MTQIRRRAGGCASNANGSRRRANGVPSSTRSSPRRCAGAADLMSDIAALKSQILAAIAAAPDEAALEAVRVAALGRQGSVSALLKNLGALPPQERREHGLGVNAAKDEIGAAIEARRH